MTALSLDNILDPAHGALAWLVNNFHALSAP